MPVSTPVTSLTPMMRQYLEVKAQHPGALLMYRMGDFYEMFFEDARAAAPILEVQLTARHKGTESEVPMCGVPHHALEGYLAKLLAAGLKVAICDQVEDPALAKGLVKRELKPGVALLGFCGAPWTVASYMIAGHGTPAQEPARLLAYRDPDTFAELMIGKPW